MNPIISFFEQQLREEADITRKMLRIVPADHFHWQPHPKSMSLLRLATHVAELPSWIPIAIGFDRRAASQRRPSAAVSLAAASRIAPLQKVVKSNGS